MIYVDSKKNKDMDVYFGSQNYIQVSIGIRFYDSLSSSLYFGWIQK